MGKVLQPYNLNNSEPTFAVVAVGRKFVQQAANPC